MTRNTKVQVAFLAIVVIVAAAVLVLIEAPPGILQTYAGL